MYKQLKAQSCDQYSKPTGKGREKKKAKVWKLWSHLLKQLQLYGAETKYI